MEGSLDIGIGQSGAIISKGWQLGQSGIWNMGGSHDSINSNSCHSNYCLDDCVNHIDHRDVARVGCVDRRSVPDNMSKRPINPNPNTTTTTPQHHDSRPRQHNPNSTTLRTNTTNNDHQRHQRPPTINDHQRPPTTTTTTTTTSGITTAELLAAQLRGNPM